MVTHIHGGVAGYSGRPCGVNLSGTHSIPSCYTERSGLSNAGDLRILVTSIECLIAVDSLFPCLTASYRLVSSGYLMLLLQTIQHHFPGLLTTLCLTRKALKNAQFW